MRRSTAIDTDVVVAEHFSAHDVSRASLAKHCLSRPLGDLTTILGIHFGTHQPDDVVGERTEREARALLIKPDVN
jgi:hypothetical protein